MEGSYVKRFVILEMSIRRLIVSRIRSSHELVNADIRRTILQKERKKPLICSQNA